MPGYLAEFRTNPRPLIGTALGLGSGLGATHYLTSIFAPHLIAQFGWARSDFALIGAAGVLVLLFLPVYGRLADIYGVRRVAAWGVLAQPLCYLAFSFQTGDVRQYLAIFIVQLFIGSATTAAVYGRIIVERYDRARGLALAIVMSSAPVLGALGAPVLSAVIAADGWRTAYRLVALVLGVLGLIALALIPRDTATLKEPRGTSGPGMRDYPVFLGNPAFLLIFFAMLLVNISQILNGSQLGLILADQGASGGTAARILSTYAIGVVAGRFFCGLALDRFRAHFVAAGVMALPGFGQLLLAGHFHATAVIALSFLLMGVTTGAEGDVGSYLVMKYFPAKIFGSVNSLISAGAGGAMGFGGILLSLTFRIRPTFDLFLVLGAFAVFGGSLLFLFLGRCRPLSAATVDAAIERSRAPVPFLPPIEARQ